MSTKGSRPNNVTNNEYFRRGYVEQDPEEHMDRMLRVTDKAKLTTKLEKMSEFKKPYLEDDFWEMEYWYTPPQIYLWDWDWIDYNIPPYIYIQHQDTYAMEISPYCGITCYSPLYCDEPVWCHESISDVGISPTWWVESGDASGGTELTGSIIETFKVKAPSGGWNGDFTDPDRDVLNICMQDFSGAVCCDEVELFCYERCVCEYEEDITWYFGNGTAIGADEILILYVTGGCKNYAWSLGGDYGDMSFDYTTTEVPYNILRAGSNPCGTAEITVTDACGDVATGEVHGPNGTWTLIDSTLCAYYNISPEPGSCTKSQTCIDYPYKYTDVWTGGNLMYEPYWTNLGCGKASCNDGYTIGVDYCYAVGYYTKKYIKGIEYKYTYKWSCP